MDEAEKRLIEIAKHYLLAKSNYESMCFSEERAKELADKAIKVWFPDAA